MFFEAVLVFLLQKQINTIRHANIFKMVNFDMKLGNLQLVSVCMFMLICACVTLMFSKETKHVVKFISLHLPAFQQGRIGLWLTNKQFNTQKYATSAKINSIGTDCILKITAK